MIDKDKYVRNGYSDIGKFEMGLLSDACAPYPFDPPDSWFNWKLKESEEKENAHSQNLIQKMTKKQRYLQMLDLTGTYECYKYLEVACSTRSKKVAEKCSRLLKQGKYGEALRIGDITAFNIGLNEFR